MATVPYLRGLVDCCSYSSIYTTSQDKNRYLYSVIYKFINDTCSDFTVKVADNFGTSGTGHDDHTSATPAGENAWCVWRYPYQYSEFRTVDLYVLIQWADTNIFGASPGDPGEITGNTNDGVGMQLAWMLNGSSPWMGTTNANGADTKGTPVWHPDAMVLPAPNNRVGEFDTNREYCAGFIDCVGKYNSVFGMIGNPDFFVWYCDVRNDQLLLRTKFWSCVDVIAPLSGTVSASCPIAMSFCGNMYDASAVDSPFAAGGGFSSDVSDSLISIGTNYDGASFNSNMAEGGAFTCNPGVNGTSSFRFSTFPVFKLSEHFPNKNVEPTINSDVAWDLLPLYVYNVDDAWGGLGTLPYIYCSTSMLPMYSPITSTVYNSPICQCQISTRYTSNLYGAFVIPWIGPAPRSQLSTEGVTFT